MKLFIKSCIVSAMIGCFMVFFTTGCTKSLPQMDADLKIPAPHFDNVQSTLSSLYVPDASGFCHKLIKRIEIKISGQNWVDLSVIDPTANISCATDGKFHFIADFNTGYLSAGKAQLQAGGSITIEVRGYSDILISEESQLVLTYGPTKTGFNTQFAVTSNNRSVSGTGNYVVTGQAKVNTPNAAGTHYFVNGTLRSK